MGLLKTVFWRVMEGPCIESLIYKACAAHDRGGIHLQLARFYQLKINKRFGCYISARARFLERLKMPHPTGIVIGDGVNVGANVTIYQNVTIGAARRGEGVSNLYPQIGNNVTIFAGAKILGAISVGEGATIAANCVVVKDVLPGQVVAGVPAKVVSSGSGTG